MNGTWFYNLFTVIVKEIWILPLTLFVESPMGRLWMGITWPPRMLQLSSIHAAKHLNIDHMAEDTVTVASVRDVSCHFWQCHNFKWSFKWMVVNEVYLYMFASMFRALGTSVHPKIGFNLSTNQSSIFLKPATNLNLCCFIDNDVTVCHFPSAIAKNSRVS